MLNVLKGATDVSVVIRIVDSGDGTPETGVTSATAGLDLKYRREGAATANLTESDLSALTDAHADGGMLHIGAGYYRVDIPDAAFATGANGVLIFGTVTGMVVIGQYVNLVAYNPQDAVRLGLTALPNAAADAAGGLIISDAGGLDADAQRADVAAILVDTGTTLDLRIPAALVGGRMDSSVGAMAANVITAAATAADFGTEVGTAVWASATRTLSGTIQSFDAFVSATGGVTVEALAANVITTTACANDFLTAAKIAPGAIDNATFAADVGSTAIATNVIGIAAKKGVVDALNVDTYAEPTGVPPATDTLVNKIGRGHQALRNKVTVTSSKKQFFDDADAALWEKDLSDDATTYTESEGNAP